MLVIAVIGICVFVNRKTNVNKPIENSGDMEISGEIESSGEILSPNLDETNEMNNNLISDEVLKEINEETSGELEKVETAELTENESLRNLKSEVYVSNTEDKYTELWIVKTSNETTAEDVFRMFDERIEEKKDEASSDEKMGEAFGNEKNIIKTQYEGFATVLISNEAEKLNKTINNKITTMSNDGINQIAAVDCYQIDGNKYETLQQAFDNAANNATIKVIADTTETATTNLTANKSVILDLNGHTITYNGSGYIIHKTAGGTLTIKDGSSSKGVMNAPNAGTINATAGTIKITGGTLKGDVGVLNLTGANAEITGGTLIGEQDCLYSRAENVTVKISGGNLTSQTLDAVSFAGSGSVEITGGTITSGQEGVIFAYCSIENAHTDIKISGSAKINSQTYGVYVDTEIRGVETVTSSVTITGGTITGAIDGVYEAGGNNITITGGTITGASGYGINNKESEATAKIVIGQSDGNVSKTSPSITGNTYGIYSASGYEFYDGIIKGKTDALQTKPTKVETNYAVSNGSESGYKTAVLLKSITDASISPTTFTYDGSKHEPTVTARWGSSTLQKDRDYTVKYEKNVDAGEGKVIVEGTGDYTGKLEFKFTIEKADAELSVTIVETEENSGKLSANVKTKSDGEISYQWWYMNGGAKVNIQNATGQTYNATQDMSRKEIGVTVTVKESSNYNGATGDSNTITIIIANYTDETTYYATMQEAFTEAVDGARITVLRNVMEEEEHAIILETDKNITLDLNEKTITLTNNHPSDRIWGQIINNGNLTIEGTGKITTDEKNYNITSVISTTDAKLTVGENVTIEQKGVLNYTGMYDCLSFTGNYTANICGKVVIKELAGQKDSETDAIYNTGSGNLNIIGAEILVEASNGFGMRVAATVADIDGTINITDNSSIKCSSGKAMNIFALEGYSNKYNINIENSIIEGPSYGIETDWNGQAEIIIKDGAKIISDNIAVLIQNHNSVKVLGGIIEGGENGIENNAGERC